MTTQTGAQTMQPKQAGPNAAATNAALTFLFIGNIVIGAGVMAPAAMLNAMRTDLGVDTVAIGALVGWGAVVLCLGAPAFAFLTNRVGRRTLLAASLGVYAVGHAASAFITDYQALLVVRLLMIGGAAVFTPQAASAVALMVPEAKRAGAVALVFMGWAVASAAVVPAMSLFSELQFGDVSGWRVACLIIAGGAALAALAVTLTTPGRLYPAAMSLKMWGGVLARPAILLLLLTTSMLMAGQFVLFPYLAAELRRVTQADANGVAMAFGFYGVAGLLGSIAAARVVGWLGAPKTQMAALASLAIGLLGWSLFAPWLAPTLAALFIWGLGFGSGVAMQQARLIGVAPALASASVALNTSVLYLGQAMGSGIGGALISQNAHGFLGAAGLGLILVAFAASLAAYRRYGA